MCWPGLWNPKHLNKTDWFYKFDNGSEIWFGGLDDKERTEKILGQEFVTIYFNEVSQIPWASRVMAISRLAQKVPGLALKAYYDLNPAAKTHWSYRVFILKQDPLTKQPLRRPFNYGYYQINPIDNAANIAEEYLHELEDLPEMARKRFLYGEYADASEGALWTEELLAQNRVMELEVDLLRITVNLDPSGCSGPEDKRSDEVGVTVTGLGTDGHGYLLEDLSGKYSPEVWGQIAEDAYTRHQADRLVAEQNYGGDMVRAVLQARDPNLPVTLVTASRGKIVRAEPISALYEQGKIHHVGYHPELEDQLCSMLQSGYQGLKSPDRADSAIWGFTELFPGMTRKADEERWTPPRVHTRERSANKRQKRKY
jgi:phage terminase large subunit-like protein